jgi:hypothetical protein
MALSKQVRARIRENQKRKATKAWQHKVNRLWRIIDMRLKLRINGVQGKHAGTSHIYSTVTARSLRESTIDSGDVIGTPQKGIRVELVDEVNTAALPDIENRRHVLTLAAKCRHHSQAPATLEKLRRICVQVTGYEAY